MNVVYRLICPGTCIVGIINGLTMNACIFLVHITEYIGRDQFAITFWWFRSCFYQIWSDWGTTEEQNLDKSRIKRKMRKSMNGAVKRRKQVENSTETNCWMQIIFHAIFHCCWKKAEAYLNVVYLFSIWQMKLDMMSEKKHSICVYT